ncbi:MAG: YhbY family RNA-binding protein [Pseudomonadales bacterium]|nr:YhbY family RNA-binding protein [Pseudomonadales bacterium]
MSLLNSQKKQYKAIGHKLKPVVTVAENGLNKGVLHELERALRDHELIKIRINVEDREDKKVLIGKVCDLTSSILIQVIGKTALVFRAADKPNPKLSNILRNQGAL